MRTAQALQQASQQLKQQRQMERKKVLAVCKRGATSGSSAGSEQTEAARAILSTLEKWRVSLFQETPEETDRRAQHDQLVRLLSIVLLLTTEPSSRNWNATAADQLHHLASAEKRHRRRNIYMAAAQQNHELVDQFIEAESRSYLHRFLEELCSLTSRTPLARFAKQLRCTAQLIAHRYSAQGKTVFTIACSRGDTLLIERLLAQGALMQTRSHSSSVLHAAAASGSASLVKLIMDRCPGPLLGTALLSRNSLRQTALDIACRHQHWQIVSLLSEALTALPVTGGFLRNHTTKKLAWLLRLLCIENVTWMIANLWNKFREHTGHTFTHQMLLSSTGWHPLHLALKHGSLTTVSVLLQCPGIEGAAFIPTSDGWYPAHVVAASSLPPDASARSLLRLSSNTDLASKHSKNLRELVRSQEATLAVQMLNGYGVLHFLARNNHASLIRSLLKSVSSSAILVKSLTLRHPRAGTPLQEAFYRKSWPAAGAILAHVHKIQEQQQQQKPTKTPKKKKKKNALSLAHLLGDSASSPSYLASVVLALIAAQQHQACADLMQLCRPGAVQSWLADRERSLLDYAVWKCSTGKVIRQLARLTPLEELNRVNAHGFAVLHTAVSTDHVDAVRALLDDHRVSVFCKDTRQRTPLQLAIQTDRQRCIPLLSEKATILVCASSKESSRMTSDWINAALQSKKPLPLLEGLSHVWISQSDRLAQVLRFASARHLLEIVRFVLDHATPTVVQEVLSGRPGRSAPLPLQLALLHCHATDPEPFVLARLLLNHGASLSGTTKQSKQPALHTLLHATKDQSLVCAFLDELSEEEFVIARDAVDAAGWNALSVCIQRQMFIVADELLARGTDHLPACLDQMAARQQAPLHHLLSMYRHLSVDPALRASFMQEQAAPLIQEWRSAFLAHRRASHAPKKSHSKDGSTGHRSTTRQRSTAIAKVEQTVSSSSFSLSSSSCRPDSDETSAAPRPWYEAEESNSPQEVAGHLFRIPGLSDLTIDFGSAALTSPVQLHNELRCFSAALVDSDHCCSDSAEAAATHQSEEVHDDVDDEGTATVDRDLPLFFDECSDLDAQAAYSEDEGDSYRQYQRRSKATLLREGRSAGGQGREIHENNPETGSINETDDETDDETDEAECSTRQWIHMQDYLAVLQCVAKQTRARHARQGFSRSARTATELAQRTGRSELICLAVYCAGAGGSGGDHDRDQSAAEEPQRGWTLLHDAAKWDLLEVAQAVLAAGHPLHVRTHRGGWTPLHYACRRGSVRVFECLLRRITAECDQKETETERLKERAFAPNDWGWTPLHTAAALRTAAVPHEREQPVLRVSRAQQRRLAALRICQLLFSCVSPKLLAIKTERESFTPLDVACRWLNVPAARLIRDAGGSFAKPPQLRHSVGPNRLLLLQYSLEILRAQQRPAAFKAHLLRESWRLLSLAIRTRCAKALQTLLEAGLNPLATDRSGDTPLHLAIKLRHRPSIRLLARYGGKAAALHENQDGVSAWDVVPDRGRRSLRSLLRMGTGLTERDELFGLDRHSQTRAETPLEEETSTAEGQVDRRRGDAAQGTQGEIRPGAEVVDLSDRGESRRERRAARRLEKRERRERDHRDGLRQRRTKAGSLRRLRKLLPSDGYE